MEQATPSQRLFIAIPLDAEFAESLLEWCEAQYPADPGIRWTLPDQLHLTLLFLGEQDAARADEIGKALEKLCEDSVQFDLVFAQVSTQFRATVPAMVWVQFDHCRAFEELSLAAATALGLHPEHKPLPHITLARIKNLKHPNRKLPQRILLDKDNLTVERIELWLSDATAAGTTYKVLGSYPLQPR